ncbi:MAG: hypothetical protein WCC66_04865 [Rhizobiaceae bacterium]
MPYRSLDPVRITATAEQLAARVAERFPDNGICGVAREMVTLSKDAAKDAETLAKPILWLRLLTGATVLAGALFFIYIGTFLSFDRISTGAFEFAAGLEASVNTIVLAIVGFITLARSEARIKRHKVFEGLHRLRSVIHVIDMHQLTKDPAALSADFKPTAASPKRITNPEQLSRYLDYCSEMFSITGKLAALYAQAVNDEVVAEAVNDIENLGTNLSRKVWQKIMLIDAKVARRSKGG